MFSVSLLRNEETASVKVCFNNGTLHHEFEGLLVDESFHSNFIVVRLTGTRVALCFTISNAYNWNLTDPDTAFLTYIGLKDNEYASSWLNWIVKNGGSFRCDNRCNETQPRPSRRCDRSIYPFELKVRDLPAAAVVNLVSQELKKKFLLEEELSRLEQAFYDRELYYQDYYDSAW